MLLYLAGHSQLDIYFAVHQSAWYNFFPKSTHEKAPKIIGNYPKKTILKGMILRPSRLLKTNLFPDTELPGLFGYETPSIQNML